MLRRGGVKSLRHTCQMRSKYRIQFDGNLYRIQKRFLGLWCNKYYYSTSPKVLQTFGTHELAKLAVEELTSLKPNKRKWRTVG